MRNDGYRQRIAMSNATLYFMAIITILLWAFRPKQDALVWSSFAFVGLITYIIVEWNNQCQLLRIRSRMNSVTFMAFALMFPVVHDGALSWLPSLCLLGSYFILFKGYGAYKAQGYTFHAFLLLSIGSLVYPPMLLLALTLLISCSGQLRMLSMKPFVASLLGLALPYWIYAALVYVVQYSPLSPHLVAAPIVYEIGFHDLTWDAWTAFFPLRLPDYTQGVPLWQMVSVGFILLLAMRAMLHFVHTSYDDKISTRQYFYTMMLQAVPVAFFACWFPADIRFTLPLLIISVTPFVAHYFALSRGRGTDYAFVFWILLGITIGLCNHLDIWDKLTSLTLDDVTSFIKNLELWKYFTT